MAQAKHAEAAQQAKIARVIATFAKRAKEAALAAEATLQDAEITGALATEDDATKFADATTMKE